MKTLIAATAALVALGCMPMAMPNAVTSVPTSVLPSGPSDIAGAVRLLDWASSHVLIPGDDDTPDKVCTQQGPPQCLDVYQGLDWCRDACGDAYWHLEYTNTCIEVMTGEVISCP